MIIEAVAMAHREKCIRRHVLIVAKNVKFHSNPTAQDQCTAENVTRSVDLPGKIGHTDGTKQRMCWS